MTKKTMGGDHGGFDKIDYSFAMQSWYYMKFTLLESIAYLFPEKIVSH